MVVYFIVSHRVIKVISLIIDRFMDLIFSEYKGEIAALVGAALWAISATVYSKVGATIPPLFLNLSKGLIAIVFILLTLLITKHQFSDLNLISLVGLTISGIMGIGVGDTAYFQALNHLGARKTLLLETLAPPLTAILAFVFLQEKLNSIIWIAMIITIIGIAWVINERNLQADSKNENLTIGIRWALVGVVSQAIGAVIARYALSTTNVSPLESALIRLIGGTIIIIILLAGQKKPLSPLLSNNWSIKLVSTLIATAFASTYLGIWLQQTAFKFAPAGIAQTLLATSPLFVLPLVAFSGEKITYQSILGAMIALLGVFLLFN